MADRAGVSIATVSHSFRRPDRIRPETRESVLRAARELGYVPSGSARSLAGGSTGALGLHLFHLLLPTLDGVGKTSDAAFLQSIVDDADAPPQWFPEANLADHDPQVYPLYVDEIQRGFVIECRDRDRPVVLSHSSTDQSEVASTAGRVDGLAVFPGRASTDDILQSMGGRPVVLFSSAPDPRCAQVNSDNRGGMRALVEHLVTIHGARSLGWAGETGGQHDFAERFASFSEAVASLPDVDMRVLDDHSLDVDATLPGVREAVQAGTVPDAIVCGSDQTALVVIRILQSQGLRVPEDVRVTGFDDVLAAQLSSPPLTTVRQQFELMGRVAAHLLTMDEPASLTVTLGVSLVTRASCGC
ncbi:LacI family DNA-binding transcriptional regulator [Microbacterium gorillae]|uniref:LacI family DNA-binding transcriptional regulator n=1 Tax=Microbacterium gorillae TaxID=1231063 RepID=UPI0018A87B4A|nr:LacI family DNA-binding transcriptional regulator [Microbacterium gorillae]